MAEKLLYEVTQDDYERARIFSREKILNDYYAGLASAENKGFRDGIETTAKTMKDQGYSIEQICKVTGLSPSELESL